MGRKLTLEDITAVVDTREQTPWTLDPIRTVRRKLDTGDYSVNGLEHVVALERKSLGDLLGCIGGDRERFEANIERLLTYPSRAIIVESTWEFFLSGNWSEFGPREPGGPRFLKKVRIYPNAAIGSVLGWMERGIPIIFAGVPHQASLCAARFLYIAARRRQEQRIEPLPLSS